MTVGKPQPGSFVHKSCLFTMKAASRKDKRQKPPQKAYIVPDDETRKLRALLILEEALETIDALGLKVVAKTYLDQGEEVTMEGTQLQGQLAPVNLENVIDGACDTIYVATGLLAACGVPDTPHLKEVCKANDTKFPGGRAKTDPRTGKYLKPLGWKPPNHKRMIDKARKKPKRKKQPKGGGPHPAVF